MFLLTYDNRLLNLEHIRSVECQEDRICLYPGYGAPDIYYKSSNREEIQQAWHRLIDALNAITVVESTIGRGAWES